MHRLKVFLEGKLAHNFIISYLVLISCLSYMVRTFIIDQNAKIDIIHIYREKKIKFQNPNILGFFTTSLEGVPWNYIGIPLSDKLMYAKLNYKEK